MKSFNDVLSKNPSLTRKITYEELIKEEGGFDDSSLEEAYEKYKEACKKFEKEE